VEELPFIDELSQGTNAPPHAVWAALSRVLRGMSGASRLARILGCDPLDGTPGFSGQPGETVPGFRVVESEPGRRLALRGRHRFASYALTFVIDGAELRAETRAGFPGLQGKLYRATVIGSGAHRIVTRRLLRQIARAAGPGGEGR
jgi:hypothetical protein